MSRASGVHSYQEPTCETFAAARYGSETDLTETIERLLELDDEEVAKQRERAAFLSVMDTVIETLPDALIVTDFRGKIVLFNHGAEMMFGHHRSEMVGQPVEMLMPERLRHGHQRDRELFSRFHVNKRAWNMGIGTNLFGLHKDGHEFATEITLSRMVVPRGVFNLATVRFVPDRGAELAVAHPDHAENDFSDA